MKNTTKTFTLFLDLHDVDVSKIKIPKSMKLVDNIVTVVARDHDAAIFAVKNIFGIFSLSGDVQMNKNRNKKKRKNEQKATRGSVKNVQTETASELEAVVKKTKIKKCNDYRFRGFMFLNYGRGCTLFD
jgi:hypothetical protein